MNDSVLIKLESALADTSGVRIPTGVDAKRYYADLAGDIRKHICSPFQLNATIMPPGFPDTEEGSMVSGLCVAHNAGYWLVYQSELDRFCCFWGTDKNNLGAHGVFGSPLYCWSA